jgi:SAM-dependent methyltransferase
MADGARRRARSRVSPTRGGSRRSRQKVVLNLGSGSADGLRTLPYFESWKELRVDVNPEVEPDIVASAVDLGDCEDGAVDAVWSSHCIEHLLPHEVPLALKEIRRVLSPAGFALIVVPDLQAVAAWVAEDRLHEVIYESPAGPVTAHDVIFGFGPAIERGETCMAHRCGFTPTLMLERLQEARFAQILLRRRATLELGSLVTRRAHRKPEHCAQLMAELGFMSSVP